jgi:hypothetical protein
MHFVGTDPREIAAGSGPWSEGGLALAPTVARAVPPGAPDLTKSLGKASPIEIAAAMWNHGFAMAQEARTRGLAWSNLEGRD